MSPTLQDVLARMVTSAPRALVVDDQSGAADALATEIGAVQIFERIDCAASVAEAWEMLEKDPACTLSVVDLPLRQAHGRAGLCGLRQRFPEVPVLVFSADEDLECITNAFECGARGFATRSSPASVLSSAIRTVITGGTYVPPEVAEMLGPPPPHIRGADGAPAPDLTARQQQVLRLMLHGMPDSVIGARLVMAEGVVREHLDAIFRLFGVGTRLEAILRARQVGLA